MSSTLLSESGPDNGDGLVKIKASARVHKDLRVGGFLRQSMASSNITTGGAGTYTAAQLRTGVITRDPSGASRTDTTDTATAICAPDGLNLTDDNDTAVVILINTADAAEVITLQGGTGVTVSNAGQTIAQNESALLVFRRTDVGAVTLYIVGA